MHLYATLPYRIKDTKSATMNIFRFFHFLFKLFVKVEELSYAFTINMFTMAENYGGTFRTFIIFILENIFRGHD